MTAPVYYGKLDGLPVLWLASGQTWWYAWLGDGTGSGAREMGWRQLHRAESTKARMLEKSRFEAEFPDLPPLPLGAN
jgi:hypothetical protein